MPKRKNDPEIIRRWDAVQAKGVRRKLLATYLGLGYDVSEAAAKVGMTTRAVDLATTDPAFIAMVERVSQEHTEVMETMLLNAEFQAVETLSKLLASEQDDIRLKAATNLLDRAGKRGVVVNKVEQNTVQRTMEFKGDLNEAMARAMRDPGVRKWMLEQTDFKQLPAAANLSGVVDQGSEVLGDEGVAEWVELPEGADDGRGVHDVGPGSDLHRVHGPEAQDNLPE